MNQDDQKFMEHLNSAVKIISEWPKWKQDLVDKVLISCAEEASNISDVNQDCKCPYCRENLEREAKSTEMIVDGIVNKIVKDYYIVGCKTDYDSIADIKNAIKEAYARGCLDVANNGKLADWAKNWIEVE